MIPRPICQYQIGNKGSGLCLERSDVLSGWIATVTTLNCQLTEAERLLLVVR